MCFVRVFCLLVYLYTACEPGANGRQKRVAGDLELELVNNHVGAEHSLVLCKSSSASNHH